MIFYELHEHATKLVRRNILTNASEVLLSDLEPLFAEKVQKVVSDAYSLGKIVGEEEIKSRVTRNIFNGRI